MSIQKKFGKIAAVTAITVLVMMCFAACSENTVAEATKAVDAVSVLSDIATTQYFTEAPVSDTDIQVIVQAGINAFAAECTLASVQNMLSIHY